MKNKRRILILDDEAQFTKRHRERLKKLPSVDAKFDLPEFTQEQFIKALSDLTERRKEAMNADGPIQKFKQPCEFDHADVLIIDWDLLNLTTTGGLKKLEFVFCEDSSAFFPPKGCRQFAADLPSPYVERYVKKYGPVDYEPQVRFSL